MQNKLKYLQHSDFMRNSSCINLSFLFDVEKEDDAFTNKNPLDILKEYIAAKNLRLVDMFKQFDKDGGGSLSREEFVEGLKVRSIYKYRLYYYFIDNYRN